MTREGPFWDVMEGRDAPPPAATLLGWELVAVDPEAGTIEVAFTASEQFLNPAGVIQGGFLGRPDPARTAAYQRPQCTTSPNGRRSGWRTGASDRSAG